MNTGTREKKEVARLQGSLLYEIEVNFDFTTFQPTHSSQIEGNCLAPILFIKGGHS